LQALAATEPANFTMTWQQARRVDGSIDGVIVSLINTLVSVRCLQGLATRQTGK
jgi:hypothetical protein